MTAEHFIGLLRRHACDDAYLGDQEEPMDALIIDGLFNVEAIVAEINAHYARDE